MPSGFFDWEVTQEWIRFLFALDHGYELTSSLNSCLDCSKRWAITCDCKSNEQFPSMFCLFFSEFYHSSGNKTRKPILVVLFNDYFHFVCFVYVYVSVPPEPGPLSDQNGCQVPWTSIKEGCETACGLWELSPGPLQEQQMIFLAAQPSPDPGDTSLSNIGNDSLQIIH